MLDTIQLLVKQLYQYFPSISLLQVGLISGQKEQVLVLVRFLLGEFVLDLVSSGHWWCFVVVVLLLRGKRRLGSG